MTRANGSNGSSSTALLRQILHFVIPITAAYALEGVATLVPIWAAAHGGSPDETEATFRVGAVGLGNTVVICIALVVKSGWAGAQDTLVSQAYGMKDFRKARDHLNCCQIWMCFLAAICSVLLLSTERILISTRCATEQLAAETFRYVLGCIPGVWLEFQYDALRKFLMNQQIPSPGLWVLCAAVPAHWAMCVLLLECGLSIDPLVAIGIAFSVRSAVSFFLLAGYMTLFQPTPSCIGWWRIWESREALSWKGLKSYSRIAIPSVAMYGFDWWAYELLTLLAGEQLPNYAKSHNPNLKQSFLLDDIPSLFAKPNKYSSISSRFPMPQLLDCICESSFEGEMIAQMMLAHWISRFVWDSPT